MSSLTSNGLKRIELLYLKEEQADVWFVFENERIPAHKLILTTMSPWLNTMFFGSMPEGKEVDMTSATITSDAFKEFLQFFYTDKVKLTNKNIESVIDLAKQSLNDHIFVQCEEFLTKSITTDTMCFGYQLALRYDAPKLKKKCEDEICVNAEQVLRSSSFMEFPYEFLQQILKCDALACEEIYVFNACIAWAKADCERNEKNSSNVEHLRAQLKDSIYQIRFNSMTMQEAATCIKSCRGLFTSNELEEIMCMVSRTPDFTPTKFNWNSRYYNLQSFKGNQLVCSRYTYFDDPNFDYYFNETEKTTFTCNRRVLLNGFYCECQKSGSELVTVRIVESKSNENITERYMQKTNLNFLANGTNELNPFEGYFKLDKSILLRPNYSYVISVQFENNNYNNYNNYSTRFSRGRHLNEKVRVDHDIVIRFQDKNGMITKLNLSRFDKKNYLQKIIHNPNMWFWASVIGFSIYYFEIYPKYPKSNIISVEQKSNLLAPLAEPMQTRIMNYFLSQLF